MNKNEFVHRLADVTPEPSPHFSNHVDFVLNCISKNANAESTTSTGRRMSIRILVFALITVMLCTAGFAATRWGIFDTLGFMLGTPSSSNNAQMQKALHQETINNVEITIHEAMYDGRTLFIQYGYRMLDELASFGVLDPAGNLQDGVSFDVWKKLKNHNVGWWTDSIWIDGQCLDMISNSNSLLSGTMVPGEIIITDVWRLDNLNLTLSGKVTIALPIGDPTFDVSSNTEEKAPKGFVAFTFDAGTMQSHVTVTHPNIETVLPEVSAKVTEAAFSPLRTYITLALAGDPDALAAYKAQNGNGSYDENGKLEWSYTSQDVHQDYILSLQLVDDNGKIMFPDYSGCNGVGDDWAEFCYPCIEPENVPDTLWLAPVNGETVDMSKAIRVK